MERELKQIEQAIAEIRSKHSDSLFNQSSVAFLDKFDILTKMSRAIRKSAGLTLKQVEEATGISNAYLSQLERGKVNNPSYATLRKLFVLYYEVKEPKLKLQNKKP